MAHQQQGSSLIATIGTALTAFSYPQFAIRAPSSPATCPPPDPSLKAFEDDLARRLDQLQQSKHDGSYLNLPWLHQALDATLVTNSAVETLIPDFELPYFEREDKWVGEYLEDSAKLLDVCNALQDKISKMKHYQTQLQLALHLVDARDNWWTSDIKLKRVKNALQECLLTIKRKDDIQVQARFSSKLDSCNSTLRRMADKLAAPIVKSKPFITAIYGAKVNTIFVYGIVAAALTVKPFRPLSGLRVPSHFLWSAPLITLQRRLNDEMHRGKTNGSPALLGELTGIDAIVKQLHHILDHAVLLKMSCNEQAFELRRLAGNLREQSEELGKGLGLLEQQVNELFRMLVNSRVALLNLITHSRS
ncbi:hypothetical protein O6H91_23G027100 [Diphasiastrum complanatum]|uniref:Uncharacterized protein n=1 Tax=Diphasiastrum complanatum TaxID=34168 RepID=A0ACC2A967_DIPCM|nr:hypothetical protein O6H91_23G027100 [Diphasiastrum complanatum]